MWLLYSCIIFHTRGVLTYVAVIHNVINFTVVYSDFDHMPTIIHFTFAYRNPVAASRPGFREIFLSLLDTPEMVLSIPPEVLDSHPLAGVIGSPLEVGENMYTDLRDKYLNTDHTGL